MSNNTVWVATADVHWLEQRLIIGLFYDKETAEVYTGQVVMLNVFDNVEIEEFDDDTSIIIPLHIRTGDIE